MLWISIALVIISTEIVFTILYLSNKSNPKQSNEMLDLTDVKEKVKEIENQISNLRVAQGMRRRDG